jgi:hypothetical protein
MSAYKMPLAWRDHRLGFDPQKTVTDYRFDREGNGFVCNVSGRVFKAPRPSELADLLTTSGLADGTVEFDGWYIDRIDSVHGMAVHLKTEAQNASLAIPQQHLSTLFRKSGRGLRPDVSEWWNDTLSPQSRPWRLRHYEFSRQGGRARRKFIDFIEFASDADMLVFKLRWQ